MIVANPLDGLLADELVVIGRDLILLPVILVHFLFPPAELQVAGQIQKRG